VNATSADWSISSVWIESNYTGSLQNHTLTEENGIYKLTIPSTYMLTGRIYSWKVYANDTYGAESNTTIYTIKVFDPEDIKPVAVLKHTTQW